MSEEPEREVTAADQADINAFSRLNLRFHEIDDEIKYRKDELVNLQDASNEVMMLMDDEELVKINVGEAFADVSQEDAQVLERMNLHKNTYLLYLNGNVGMQTMLSRMTAEHEAAVSKLEGELDAVKEKMKDLKARLAAKFGKSINLEEDEH